MLPDVAGGPDAELVAQHLVDAVRAPLRLGEMEFHLDASIGIVLSSAPEDRPADLMRFADVAMYRAKREDVGSVRYDPQLDEERLRGFDLVGQLRQAIAEDQLVLHYQAKIALGSNEIVGMEGRSTSRRRASKTRSCRAPSTCYSTTTRVPVDTRAWSSRSPSTQS